MFAQPYSSTFLWYKRLCVWPQLSVPPPPPNRLRDVLFTYEHFDSRDLVQYTDAVGVTALTCRTPGGEVLFRNLSFRVQQGESLLIMGPSGSGA